MTFVPFDHNICSREWKKDIKLFTPGIIKRRLDSFNFPFFESKDGICILYDSQGQVERVPLEPRGGICLDA